VWSAHEATASQVGFAGAHDVCKGILYAKMQADGELQGNNIERLTKSAITSLLDIADSCRANKLTIGLGVEHAGRVECVCSLLYLGFEVVPTRRTPLPDCALLLDLHTGWPLPTNFETSCTDHTFSGESDCSTSAEENNALSEIECSFQDSGYLSGGD